MSNSGAIWLSTSLTYMYSNKYINIPLLVQMVSKRSEDGQATILQVLFYICRIVHITAVIIYL